MIDTFVSGMLKAGASGYLIKHCAFEGLANTIRTVAGGKPYLSSQIITTVMDDYTTSPSLGKKTIFSEIILREREILQLIAEGLKNEGLVSSQY